MATDRTAVVAGGGISATWPGRVRYQAGSLVVDIVCKVEYKIAHRGFIAPAPCGRTPHNRTRR